jgi:sugar phosphate isomerase/epimerase
MDPSHYALYRNDLPWVVKRLGDKIRHVHMKDVFGKPGVHKEDFMFPLLGEGMINWKRFLEALDSVGYKGYFSVEFESFGYYYNILESDPIRAAETSMKQLKMLEKS